MTMYCNVIHNSCDTYSTVLVAIATANIPHVESTFCCFVLLVCMEIPGKAKEDSAIDIDAPDLGQSRSCLCTLQSSAEEAGSPSCIWC